jgi:hypothetical protein
VPPGMLAQLHACHLAQNTHLIGKPIPKARNCVQHNRHQAVSSLGSRSSTTAAAAAQPTRSRGCKGDHVSGLGALLKSNQLPQAVEFLDTWLGSNQHVHGAATGELLEGERLLAKLQHGPACNRPSVMVVGHSRVAYNGTAPCCCSWWQQAVGFARQRYRPHNVAHDQPALISHTSVCCCFANPRLRTHTRFLQPSVQQASTAQHGACCGV